MNNEASNVAAPPNPVAAMINEGPISGTQVLVVVIAVVLHMLDGFDILVMSFAATPIAADWELSAPQLGFLLSAGLIGMALGSVFLAPMGDRLGRRYLVLLSLSLISAGMLLSTVCQDMYPFIAMRLLTGFGIGGILVSLNVITAEYTPLKWRTLCLTIFAAGYPLGATFSGAVSGFLITDYGWRSVFLVGALCSALMIPLVYLLLPESLEHLLAHRRADTLETVNRILSRIGRQPVASLPPETPATVATGNTLADLFQGSMSRSTLLLWVAFFAILFNFYFVMSWTPRLLTEAGLSAQESINGGVALNLGGIVGGLTLGYLAAWLNLQRLIGTYMLLAILFTLGFSQSFTQLPLGLVFALGIGFALNAAIAGLFALGPAVYPVACRSTGVGWAIGVGRVGALLSPLAAGALIDVGWSTSSLYLVFALSIAVAMLASLMIKRPTT